MTKNGMRPVHPGEILREDYLAELGMSANALEIAAARKSSAVASLMKATRSICHYFNGQYR
ncbi:MAG TPA: hypothetical protein VII66_03525 [Gemmatimonadaceae bacterium]